MVEYTKESALSHLKENWNNVGSPVGFLGVNKIYDFYDHVISVKLIKKVLSSFESHSLMSEVHIPNKQNATIAFYPRDAFQIDIFYVNEISSDNDGINYIFSAIDIFTKRGFCVPQIKCNAESSISSMKIILNSINVRPKSIICDPGSEFKNAKFKKYLSNIGVNLIFSKSENKCSTVERFQKTIQRKIYLYITEYETRRFIHILDKILVNYNTTKHSFLGASPFSVETDKDLQNKVMILHARKNENVKKKKPQFSIGDIVRVALKKSTFHRSYNLQRTYERFIVESVNTKLKIPRYGLKDENGNKIDGYFSSYEMIRVDLSRYRATIIKSRSRNKQTQYLHSFKGYGPQFDLWLTIADSDPKYFR
jgi:hypothetical protein